MREYIIAIAVALQPVTTHGSPALIALQRAGTVAGRLLDKPFERARMARIHVDARVRCYSNCRKKVKSVHRPVKYGQARLRRLSRQRSKRIIRCMSACKL